MVILFVLAGIFVAVGAFVTPLVIVESTGPFASIRRNIHLAGGNVRRLSFAVIGSYLFVSALDSVLGFTLNFGLSAAIFSWLHVSKTVHNVFELIVSSGVGAVLHPFTMIALTLFYFDQRVRNDGLDIAIAIQNVEALIALDIKPQEQVA